MQRGAESWYTPPPGCFYYVIAGVGLSCGVSGYVIDKYAVNNWVNLYVAQTYLNHQAGMGVLNDQRL